MIKYKWLENFRNRRDVMSEGFTDRLRQLRQRRNLKQSELASKAGMSTVHYGRYERGEVEPSAGTLTQIAEALGVTRDYLLTGEGLDEHFFDGLEDRHLFRQFKEVERLPDKDKEIVKELIDAFLFKRKIKDLATN